MISGGSVVSEMSMEERIARLRGLQLKDNRMVVGALDIHQRSGKGRKAPRTPEGEIADRVKITHRYSDEAWKGLVALAIERVRFYRDQEMRALIGVSAEVGFTEAVVRSVIGDSRKLTGGRSVGLGVRLMLHDGTIKGVDNRPAWVKVDEVEKLEWALSQIDEALEYSGVKMFGGTKGVKGGVRVGRWKGPVWWEEIPESDVRPHIIMMHPEGLARALDICQNLGILYGKKGWGGDSPKVGCLLECIGLGWIV